MKWLFLALGCASLVRAQSFEVATIKPIVPGAPHMAMGPRILPGGRLVIEDQTLKGMLVLAFHIAGWQIAGGDGWIAKQEYDVEAKPSGESRSRIKDLRASWVYGIEDEHLRQLLQTLLIDRFQLKFHREMKTGTIYVLEMSGKPIKLQPATHAGSASEGGFTGSIGFAGGRWGLFNTTMPRLAQFAADYELHAPVEDRTNLSGAFDYRQPAPLSDSDATTTDNTDSFLRLIPEIGLKLTRTTGQVEMFVIDRAEKPSAN